MAHLADVSRRACCHAGGMRVLNISVSEALLAQWRSRLAPPHQPFFLTEAEAEHLGLPTLPRAEVEFALEERDTYTLWKVPREVDRVAWLSVAEFGGSSAAQRQALLQIQVRHGRGNLPRRRDYADLLPHLTQTRFLWMPELLTPAVLTRIVSAQAQACQREQVPQGVWDAAIPVLPRVCGLAGTFSAGPGNCFGAVMGAAGVNGAENEWMQREPFEVFLGERTLSGGADDQPGTLLLWRSADGLAQHCAVTLGSGWAFHKPSQSWMTPRVVLPVQALEREWRLHGQRLSRLTLA